MKEKKRKEIENLEENINEREIHIENLDKLLCEPEIYEDPEKALELSQKGKIYNRNWINSIING